MADETRITISLPPELQRVVTTKIATGKYTTPDEVIHEGLRLVEERDRALQAAVADLRDKVAAGMNEARRGEFVDGDEFFAELEREEDAKPANSRRSA